MSSTFFQGGTKNFAGVFRPPAATLVTVLPPRTVYMLVFMHLCVPCYCDACWKSSALRVGVKTLHNTIASSVKRERPFWGEKTSGLLLRSESSRGNCTKLHTAAASNNRDHAPRSLFARTLVILFNRSQASIGRDYTPKGCNTANILSLLCILSLSPG